MRCWIGLFSQPSRDRGLDLGTLVIDGEMTRGRVAIPHGTRSQGISLTGRSGSGKSFLNRYLAQQDIFAGRGFLYFDLHGDATPFLVAAIASRERASDKDYSERLVLIDPADTHASVGLNPLELRSDTNQFVQISEFVEVLKKRWQLDSFGARTDELLRNSLHVLADNSLTLIELRPLLCHSLFRVSCLKNIRNAEVRDYFETRFDQVSEPMRASMREPILNKISAFTADPHFRHIVGQQESSFSVRDAMDRGLWVIANLHKGKLGEQAATLGSLLLTLTKNAVFARQNRELFTLYCDEVQNLVAYGSEIETLLSEGRKFSVGIISANQFTDQLPTDVRAALQAVGTHIYFQLSSSDAHHAATALDGGKSLAELLKNLPRRHFVIKTGSERWRHGVVPTVREPHVDSSDLVARCRARWARSRTEIEQDIQQRFDGFRTSAKEDLHDWE